MNSMVRWRYLFSFLLLAAFIVLAVIFRSWLVTYWIEPLAFLLWTIVRLFLSVHQSVYWAGLIFLAFYLALYILPRKPEKYTRYFDIELQVPVNRLDHWYQLILNAPKQASQGQALKKELKTLVQDWERAKKNSIGVVWTDFQATQQDSIPIEVSTFLDSKPKAGLNPLGVLKNWMKVLFSRWIPWHPNKSHEYEDAIHQVISFIETNMETNIDE